MTIGDQQVIKSCAIITTPANELIESLHDRMPAILEPESYEVWLNQRTDPRRFEENARAISITQNEESSCQ